MNRKHAVLALAAVALSSAALADTDLSVLGAGTATMPDATVAISPAPADVMVVPVVPSVNGMMVADAGSYTTVSTTPAGAKATTVYHRYWLGVPPGAEHRADFQRWMQLK
ncbi:hypothetical protein HHL11_28925 [Ramlibacter sp. G-1-2-2]|uniref:DUF2271 domain-containing protein n=1 Tax=Ramlibacter agri TaxID=2728837 RepID=A0A848HBH2_9BURK|nr:hypothetical protein [Ramlibacter agri]NML47807.1 hypothetical protein [Ramlibacter agri]